MRVANEKMMIRNPTTKEIILTQQEHPKHFYFLT